MFQLLDAPSVRSKPKVTSIAVKKGTEVRLKCEADGNPQPTFTWHKNSEIVRSGLNSSWNVSILIVQYIGEEDFARFVCTAKNRVGWDALTFNVEPARGIFWNLSSCSDERDNLTCWFDGLEQTSANNHACDG